VATPLEPRPMPRRSIPACSLFVLVLTLAACGRPMRPPQFAGTVPAFDPLSFWAGHHRSWGVLENRGGAPTDTVETDCVGIPLPDGSLRMAQSLTLGDGTVTHRDWHLWRTGPDSYAATANDMVGTAHGKAGGRVFHWNWVLALSPGNALKNVVMDQWMYLYADGTMMNHTTIRKLGLTMAQVSERFEKVQ
jgi:hypothetical protein